MLIENNYDSAPLSISDISYPLNMNIIALDTIDEDVDDMSYSDPFGDPALFQKRAAKDLAKGLAVQSGSNFQCTTTGTDENLTPATQLDSSISFIFAQDAVPKTSTPMEVPDNDNPGTKSDEEKFGLDEEEPFSTPEAQDSKKETEEERYEKVDGLKGISPL